MTPRFVWRSLASAVVLAGCVALVSAQPAAQTKPAASVNNEVITEAEVKAILDGRGISPTPLTEEQKKTMVESAIAMLVDDALMRQFLRKYVPPASPQDVQKEMNDLVEDLKKKGKTLQEYLKESGQTEDQLRGDIAGAIQWRAYLANQIPEQTAKAYYEANKLHFDKVLVKASHILVAVKAGAAPQEQKAAQAKIEAIRQEIAGGKIDFAEAAKKYSDCAASKDQGGDIGHFRYKFVVVEPIAKTAFAMKVGEISGPVATEFGFHLLKVTDRTAGEPSTYDALKEAVREVYALDHDWHPRIIAEQRKNAKIEVFMK